MVPLTRLDGRVQHLNADLIASVEEFHDTVLTLVDGRSLVVAETAEQVVAEVMRYRARVIALANQLAAEPPPPETARREALALLRDRTVVPLRIRSPHA